MSSDAGAWLPLELSSLICVASAVLALALLCSSRFLSMLPAASADSTDCKDRGVEGICPRRDDTSAADSCQTAWETNNTEGVACPFEADILSSLCVSTSEVQRLLGVSQRCADGRAHPAWIEARRNRLTASRFAAACGAKGAKKTTKEVVQEMLHLPEARPEQANRFGVQYE